MELDFVFITESYQLYADSNSAHLVLLCNKGNGSPSVLRYWVLSSTSLEIQNTARENQTKEAPTGPDF